MLDIRKSTVSEEISLVVTRALQIAQDYTAKGELPDFVVPALQDFQGSLRDAFTRLKGSDDRTPAKLVLSNADRKLDGIIKSLEIGTNFLLQERLPDQSLNVECTIAAQRVLTELDIAKQRLEYHFASEIVPSGILHKEIDLGPSKLPDVPLEVRIREQQDAQRRQELENHLREFSVLQGRLSRERFSSHEEALGYVVKLGVDSEMLAPYSGGWRRGYYFKDGRADLAVRASLTKSGASYKLTKAAIEIIGSSCCPSGLSPV